MKAVARSASALGSLLEQLRQLPPVVRVHGRVEPVLDRLPGLGGAAGLQQALGQTDVQLEQEPNEKRRYDR